MPDPTDERPPFGRGYSLTQEVNKIFEQESMVDVSEALVLLVAMWAVNLHPDDDFKRDFMLEEFVTRVKRMLPIFKSIANNNLPSNG